jgi:hypothetical protein
MDLTCYSRRMQSVSEAVPPMTTSRIPAPAHSPSLPDDEVRPGLRAKTVATRLTPEELGEVEAAAAREGNRSPNGSASWP